MSDKLTFRTDMDFTYGVPKVMAPGVMRLVANNPSPYTYKGTNAYLIGTTSLALIDPGPSDAAHLASIIAAAAGRPITHILVTHTHADHVAGLAEAVRATGAKTAGYGPYQITSKVVTERLKADGGGSEGGSGAQPPFHPDIVLKHGDRLAGDSWAVTAVHTPGHLPDHLCFALEGEATGIVFSGDHIMGWNTSIVAPPEGRMGDYNRSLEVLAARPNDTVYFPGHGGRVEQPQRVAKAYLLHRRMREQSIHEAIVKGASTIPDVVAKVYAGLDPRLMPAAAMSVLAHVEHLEERGLVRPSHPLSANSRLKAV
jgi:glyoxylase-like metal-dependent hydrolase (beta-lactamase superfamily II)